MTDGGETDGDLRARRGYWIATVVALVAAFLTVIPTFAFMFSRPYISIPAGVIWLTAMLSVWLIDRHMARRGLASLWQGNRPRWPK
ncbi:hypothetical protein [Homoserinibacter sp. GY 40078]|uniref:hypothetical protein n=1 Tax=Homoserinibacter sp. GY 40078 TaxID=2603275 RepID=UPI0011CA6E62|nr:hypothetical protein [Homoserinibacter sp. GY 40078]TXK18762.1 hypothetical protein FVQ89_02130 [Homoserinibacter sp. GY 40078]